MDVGEECLEKAKAELGDLTQAGVVLAGNAFSHVLLVKGEAEAQGSALLCAADGEALRAALSALGYAPEDWAGLSTRDADGAALSPDTLRLAVTTLDPSTLVALDDQAAAALREAYADELIELENLEAATLMPGVLARILGMRVLNLGGFEASLNDPKTKQLMWARLKLLPPLGEPY